MSGARPSRAKVSGDLTGAVATLNEMAGAWPKTPAWGAQRAAVDEAVGILLDARLLLEAKPKRTATGARA